MNDDNDYGLSSSSKFHEKLANCKKDDEIFYYGEPAKFLHDFGNGRYAIEILTGILHSDEGYMDHYKLPDYLEPVFTTLIVGAEALSFNADSLKKSFDARKKELEKDIEIKHKELVAVQKEINGAKSELNNIKAKDAFYIKILEKMERIRQKDYKEVVFKIKTWGDDKYLETLSEANRFNDDKYLRIGFYANFEKQKNEEMIQYDGNTICDIFFSNSEEQTDKIFYDFLVDKNTNFYDSEIKWYQKWIDKGGQRIPVIDQYLSDRDKELANSIEGDINKLKNQIDKKQERLAELRK